MKIDSKKIFIASIVIIFLFLAGLKTIPIIWGHIYTGDHIRIHLDLKYQGVDMPLEDLEITLINKEDKVSSNSGTYSTRGKAYGEYDFRILIPKGYLPGYEKDLTLVLNYMNANDWYISDSYCSINLENEDGMILGDYSVKIEYNDGAKANYEDRVEAINEVVSIHWGV